MYSKEQLRVHTFVPVLDTDPPQQKVLVYNSRFCPPDQDPFKMVEWKTVDVLLKDVNGKTIFEQKDVEAPVGWSEMAVRIAAQKYFRGRLGTPERERSVRALVERVTSTISIWARQQHYFATEDDLLRFKNDLTYLLITQRGAFNSPVWFNLGVPNERQQASACFIQSVQDDMESIAQLQYNETMIFKLGSGTGSNLSPLRSAQEHLRSGGTASGPVSFMKGFDTFAGVIKSGGKTRRAAKMVILNADHPDILEFIDCKMIEEKKAQALIAAGFSKDFDDPSGAYGSIAFQNANHSVRVTDEFMELVEDALADPDGEYLWDLRSRTTGDVVARVPVLEVWKHLCAATWGCGDPGIQFDTTINAWHTCPSDGRINASNPCGEYHFLDDSACNLASLNLMKFRLDDGHFDSTAFVDAVKVFILAQDIIVDPAFYPTARITENSHKYRPLGVGYANLGAYLMSLGIPYDSDAGRNLAAEITSIMSATAYTTSAQIAAVKGPFEAFERNRASMLDVIEHHGQVAKQRGLESAAMWGQAYDFGDQYGFANAQVSVLAPTGTIGFLMDCDTTGIEPEIALYKEKHLVGGGTVVLENHTVTDALTALKYSPSDQAKALQWLAQHKCFDGCPQISSKHLAVFDCAMAPEPGKRMLSLDAHLRMTAAVQPFLSGAISKTMNTAFETTPEQIGEAFLTAWRYGIKNITIYRDGCKQSQPIVTNTNSAFTTTPTVIRRRLRDHQTNAHRIRIEYGTIKMFVNVTPYEDTGRPGEIFVHLAKEGSTISGLVDGWATAISYCLQAGIPLEDLVDKFAHTKFEPSGRSLDPDVRYAHSIYDAIMRKLSAVFLQQRRVNGEEDEAEDNEQVAVVVAPMPMKATRRALAAPQRISDNPPCTNCGGITVRSGANCFKCPICGTSAGCS